MVSEPFSILPVHKRQPLGYRFLSQAYDHFQLILPQTGVLECRTGGRSVQAGMGSAVVLRRGGRVELCCRESGYAGIGINAHGELPPWMDGETTVARPRPSVLHLADVLTETMAAAQSADADLLRHCCLALCHGVLVPRADPPDDELVARARLRLTQHLGTARPVREILAGLGLSYRQLSRRFRAATGCGPKAFLTRLRIREAERLLTGTDLDILSIALELGFPSSQHFATVFKRHTGRRPGALRMKSSRRAP